MCPASLTYDMWGDGTRRWYTFILNRGVRNGSGTVAFPPLAGLLVTLVVVALVAPAEGRAAAEDGRLDMAGRFAGVRLGAVLLEVVLLGVVLVLRLGVARLGVVFFGVVFLGVVLLGVVRLEVARLGVVRRVAVRLDVLRLGVVRLGVARLEVARRVAVRLDVARLDVLRLGVARPDAVRLEVARLGVARRVAVRLDAVLPPVLDAALDVVLDVLEAVPDPVFEPVFDVALDPVRDVVLLGDVLVLVVLACAMPTDPPAQVPHRRPAFQINAACRTFRAQDQKGRSGPTLSLVRAALQTTPDLLVTEGRYRRPDRAVSTRHAAEGPPSRRAG
jgi:hypothetical protein